jgi:hypothetical protein
MRSRRRDGRFARPSRPFRSVRVTSAEGSDSTNQRQRAACRPLPVCLFDVGEADIGDQPRQVAANVVSGGRQAVEELHGDKRESHQQVERLSAAGDVQLAQM